MLQALHFRVSEAAVNGVTCVKGQELILAASADTSVHMYNYKGGLVGTFGVHEWLLDDVSTHQDPDAQNNMPVLDAVEALCSVAAVREAIPGAFQVVWDVKHRDRKHWNFRPACNDSGLRRAFSQIPMIHPLANPCIRFSGREHFASSW